MPALSRLARGRGIMTCRTLHDSLIAVVGATGTGKSELAVAIAQRFNGEIINGDAMQLYHGLPVITNKITAEEQKGIPHHLLGCIGLEEQTWVVGTFVEKALKTIREIRSRGKLPILVGGTHYYTQSLLFAEGLTAAPDVDEADDKDVSGRKQEEHVLLDQPTDVLLAELNKVDPVMAERWHPNDRRKIRRSLEIYLKTGKRASEMYEEQRLRKSLNTQMTANSISDLQEDSGMRSQTLIFWTHAETDALRARLDTRVDGMIENGLLDEVQTLHAHACAQNSKQVEPTDETRGIWVSIGYKEFKAYVEALKDGCNDQVELQRLKSDAVERTKIATRQYAKRQIRWIRIKLLNALLQAGEGDRLYLLDGTQVQNFQSNVVDQALPLVEQFLNEEPMPVAATLSAAAAELLVPKRDYDLSAAPERWTKQYCQVCDVTCVTPESWAMHSNSKTHRKLVSKHKAQMAENCPENGRAPEKMGPTG